MSRICSSLAVTWLCGIVATANAEDVIYQKPVELIVRGEVVDSTDGLFRVFPHEVDLDLNRDGLSDLRFRHSLTPRPQRVDFESLSLLRIAEAGIRDNLDIVLGLRKLAINAATQGVYDHDALARLQSQLDSGREVMHRNTKAQFNGLDVLNGSFGLNSVASTGEITPLSTTSDTMPSSYAIEVIRPAERGNLNAPASQTESLGSDETLVLNEVVVELNQGMTQQQVVDRINDFALQTGVIADVSSDNGATRLYAHAFGSDAKVCALSNRAATADSSGIGQSRICDAGSDIEVSVGGHSYTGNGATLLATDGPEKGLAFRVEESIDPVKTIAGPAGTIDITDNSPIFVVDNERGESKRLSIPDVRPSALGLGVAGNQFASLAELKIFSASQANDSLAIIDRSIDELNFEHDRILDFLAMYALPYGMGSLESLNNADWIVGQFGLLPGGIEIGPGLDSRDGELLLQSSEVFRDIKQSGFIGARVPVDNGFVYAWIGVELNGDSSITISDFAWNSVANEVVITGVASHRGIDSFRPGDANMDGTVDFADFLICSGNFGNFGRWNSGDFNDDQRVNFADFLILSANFQGTNSAVSVPEPTSGWPFTIAICLVASMRRKREHAGTLTRTMGTPPQRCDYRK